MRNSECGLITDTDTFFFNGGFPMPTLTGEQLENIAFHLFCAAGAPEEHSRPVARHLAENNLAGHDSHGFIRILQYIRQIREGVIRPAAKPEIVSESPSTAQVVGHYGFGQVVAKFSTELAVAKAKNQGVSCVTMRHLRHLGRLGAYAEMAANAGCAAILYCSTGGQALSTVPFGGTRRKLGTNPIAMSFPSEEAGSFTIPAMKRAGYSPEYAAAIEACASTGSDTMPPVLGGLAFMMVVFFGIDYADIVI